MSSTTTFAPHQSSPLARTTSPFKDPRPPPCTPGKTAKLWDEYERRAVENARRRETTCATPPRPSPQSTRTSSGTVMSIIKSYDPHSSPKPPHPPSSATRSPQFDFGFSNFYSASTTVAECKTCKRPVTSALGICEKCKKTIILPPASGETTPPLSPAARNFASTDLPQLQKGPPPGKADCTSTSPKRRSKSKRPPSMQLVDLPIRLSSLRPPPPLSASPRSSAEGPRPRKTSLTDPNEPALRLQISRKPVPTSATHPNTPTTPPSTSHSHRSAPNTRPPSLANITTPPTPTYPSTRHNSATPSELSTLYPYISSSTTTSPPSVCRASYQLQNTTSAWDDWDSEDEEEKVGLVGYWRARKWRGSKGSHSAQGVRGRRDSAANDDTAHTKIDTGKKRRGFVRVISCGCNGE